MILLLQGLVLFPAVVIVPMLEILWVLFIMVSGGLYFGDFETFDTLQIAMFCVGVFVLLLGIFCLIPSDVGPGMFRAMQRLHLMCTLVMQCRCISQDYKISGTQM